MLEFSGAFGGAMIETYETQVFTVPAEAENWAGFAILTQPCIH